MLKLNGKVNGEQVDFANGNNRQRREQLVEKVRNYP